MNEKKQKLIDIVKKIENEDVLNQISEYVETYVIIYDCPQTFPS